MDGGFKEHVFPVQAFYRELTRKAIHVSVAIVPTMANWNFLITVILLSAGIVFYVVNENARISGKSKGMVSLLTEMSTRPTEQGFVWGPVTLGFGALAALLYYPHPAATVAIYALAFGDGVASLAGKFLSRGTVVSIGEKTLSGSISCFLAVYVSALMVLNDYFLALLSAVSATIFELVSIQDVDNLVIPLGTGFVVMLLV